MNDQQAFFDEPSHRYPIDAAVHPSLSQQLEMEHLQQSLGILSGNRILDFGAGSGRVTFWFLKRGYDVTAVDVSPKSLRGLRRVYTRERQSSWGTLTTANRLPQEAGAYDAVVGADILHHVDINKYLPLLYRTLKPGGRVAFSEPNAWHLPWYIFLLWQRLPWSIERGILLMSIPKLTTLFRENGFRNVSINGHGLLPTSLTRSSINVTLGNLPVLCYGAFRLIVSGQKIAHPPLL